MAVKQQSALWAARRRHSQLKGGLVKFENRVAKEREERLETIRRVEAEIVWLAELEAKGVKPFAKRIGATR